MDRRHGRQERDKMADNTGVYIEVMADDDWRTGELKGQPVVRDEVDCWAMGRMNAE